MTLSLTQVYEFGLRPVPAGQQPATLPEPVASGIGRASHLAFTGQSVMEVFERRAPAAAPVGHLRVERAEGSNVMEVHFHRQQGGFTGGERVVTGALQRLAR